jgi:hypothetical protein
MKSGWNPKSLDSLYTRWSCIPWLVDLEKVDPEYLPRVLRRLEAAMAVGPGPGDAIREAVAAMTAEGILPTSPGSKVASWARTVRRSRPTFAAV